LQSQGYGDGFDWINKQHKKLEQMIKETKNDKGPKA